MTDVTPPPAPPTTPIWEDFIDIFTSPSAVFAYGTSVVSPRNSRYGLGTSTVVAVCCDLRCSAETVAKEIPVVENDQE